MDPGFKTCSAADVDGHKNRQGKQISAQRWRYSRQPELELSRLVVNLARERELERGRGVIREHVVLALHVGWVDARVARAHDCTEAVPAVRERDGPVADGGAAQLHVVRQLPGEGLLLEGCGREKRQVSGREGAARTPPSVLRRDTLEYTCSCLGWDPSVVRLQNKTELISCRELDNTRERTGKWDANVSFSILPRLAFVA